MTCRLFGLLAIATGVLAACDVRAQPVHLRYELFVPAPENPNLAKNDQEEKALEALAQMREGMAPPLIDRGRLLRLLTESTGGKVVVAIGTANGEGADGEPAVWMALALRATEGRLHMHEVDPKRAKSAEANFKKAGVDDLITMIVGDPRKAVKRHKGPIDILFLDGDMQDADFLDTLLPLIRPGGLIIASHWGYLGPDPRYLKAITKSPGLETSFLLRQGAGLSITLKKR
jgi:predicted O-methyltransferase YrrM